MTTPYVGPGPFGDRQRLFGRDAEIEELQWRLVADRVIVLYSPSGAGKTSLLTAKNGLVAELRERFHVLPLLRVGAVNGANPVQAILGQLETAGCGPRLPDDGLASYFGRIEIPEAHPPKRLLMVLDQFEEIFTNLTPLAEQREFFRQLGELLAHEVNPVWLLVSMREEYFSWLDSFRDLVPTRLANTFRLGLLTTAQAVVAIKGPAEEAGVAFPAQDGEDAAARLVYELSKIRVRSPGGGVETRTGSTVEAVQLQVICADLWNRLSADGRSAKQIRVDDVVDYRPETALQQYCDKTLDSLTARRTRASALRDWIDAHLLTPSGLRAPAMADPVDPDCPRADELSAIEAAYLIRRLSREDGEWYELAHDSLVAPLRRSIEAWRARNLEDWQQLARSWNLGGEHSGFFKSLPATGRQVIPRSSDPDLHSDVECRFIEEYRQYRRNRRTRLYGYAMAAVLLCVLGFQYREWLAAKAEVLSTRDATAVQAGVLSILGGQPSIDLNARASVAGVELQERNTDFAALNFKTLLGEFLNRTRQIESLESAGDGISKMVVLDADHLVVAEVGNNRQAIEVRDTGGPGAATPWSLPIGDLKAAAPNGVRTVALLDKGLMVTGDTDGNLRLWDLKRHTLLAAPLSAPTDDAFADSRVSSAVRTLTFYRGVLYVGNERGLVTAWDVSALPDGAAKVLWNFKVMSRVSAIAVSGDGGTVAIADFSDEEKVTVLKIAGGAPHGRVLKLEAVPKERTYRGAFYSVAISPDQRLVAAGNRAGKIHVWNLGTGEHVMRIDGHEQAVARLRFLRDGRLASIGWDGRLKLWNLVENNLAPLGRTVLEISRQLASAAMLPDESGAYVATERGDVLRVSFAADKHPFGQFLTRSGLFAGLGEGGGHLALFAISRDSVTTADLDRKSGTTSNVVHTPLSGQVVGVARAGKVGLAFVAEATRVTVWRDGHAQGQELTGLPLLRNEQMVSINTNDDGSLIIARTWTTDRPSHPHTRVWALASGSMAALPCEATLPTDFVNATRIVAFRPGANQFVTVASNIVNAWTVVPAEKGCPTVQKASYPLQEVPGEILTLAFDPSGRFLWVGNFANQLYSYDFSATRPTLSPIRETPTAASALAVSAGESIALGDSSGRLFVFEPASRLPIQIAQDWHDSQISSIAISGDAQWLVSSSDAGTAVWDLRISTWTARACKLAANRTFSASETQAYFARVSDKPTPCAPPA